MIACWERSASLSSGFFFRLLRMRLLPKRVQWNAVGVQAALIRCRAFFSACLAIACRHIRNSRLFVLIAYIGGEEEKERKIEFSLFQQLHFPFIGAGDIACLCGLSGRFAMLHSRNLVVRFAAEYFSRERKPSQPP